MSTHFIPLPSKFKAVMEKLNLRSAKSHPSYAEIYTASVMVQSGNFLNYDETKTLYGRFFLPSID